MTRPVVEEAHAKINLTLEILGRRPDGYHNIVSVMQTVGLHDIVTVEEHDAVEVVCDAAGVSAEENLATKAADALRHRCGVREGALVRIKKSIPVSAGLGGGSSDAAATLRALNRLWGLGLSDSDLVEVGAEIGSDVPFLVHGGTALVQGRGEDVTPLPPANLDWILVLSPDISVVGKTAALFSRITESMYTRGALTHKLAGRIRAGSDTPAELLFNVFDAVAPEAFDGWSEYRNALTGYGAREIFLSGAGPSMFTVPPRRESGTAWQLLMQRTRGWQAFLTKPWTPGDGTDA